MSDSDEQEVTDEENQQEDNEDEEDDEQEDEDEEEEEEDAQDQDQEDGDEQEDQQGDEDGSENQQDQQQQNQKQKVARLPTFKPVQTSPEFKFQSLLSQISSLGHSVDSFITTLPSRGGSGSYYRSSYEPQSRFREREEPSLAYTRPMIAPHQSKVTIMKDEDVQVSMQPQIIIQPTIKEEPKKQAYKVSNQSTKFLAQLYQQNKKLRRFQNVSNYSQSSGFLNSKDRFERKEYEKGIFNVDDRNKQIDEAIEMLRREQQEQ